MEVGLQKGCREMPKTHQGGGPGAEEKRTATGRKKYGEQDSKGAGDVNVRASSEANLNGICVGACHWLLTVMGTSHLGAADSGVRIGRAGVSHSTPVNGDKPANRKGLSDAVESRFCTVAGKGPDIRLGRFYESCTDPVQSDCSCNQTDKSLRTVFATLLLHCSSAHRLYASGFH